MAINTGVPTSLKRPGVFSKFLYSQAGQSLIPLEQAVNLVGIKSAAGTAVAEQPIEVFGDTDADTKFGVGSELALMCRWFYAQSGFQGVQPRLFATPIAAPAGTANAQTITITGPATADGNLELRVAGRPISVGVTNGDSAAIIAAALQAQLAARVTELPVTATVLAGVVTITHVTTGVNGAAVTVHVDRFPTGVGVAVATTAAGTGAVDVTAALDATLNRDYDAVAIANFTGADITDAKAHTAEAWGINAKRYRHMVLGFRGTLGGAQALATASNDPTVIIPVYEDCPNTPGEIAAVVAARVWGYDRPNANYDNARLVLYPPPNAGSVFKATEVESALSGGLTPLRPTPEGDQTEIVRLVTTKVSTAGAPDFATFDLATTRVAAFMARQVEARWVAEFSGPDALMYGDDSPDDVKKRARDLLVSIHLQMEAQDYIRDVDDFLTQIRIEENPSVAGRLDAVNPFRVVSPLHQAAFVHHAYL